MKKIIVFCVLLVVTNSVFSQGWLDVGLKGGYGLDFLINKNISDDESHEQKFSFGNVFGGKIGWNFNDDHAVNVDIMYSTFGIDYEYFTTSPIDSSKSFYTKKFNYSSLDFLFLYRNVKNTSYVELGPQFSLLKKASFTSDEFSISNETAKSNLVDSYFSAVLGVGGFIAGGENFRLTLGLRAIYTLNDIISDIGISNNYPSGNNYDSYVKSNPISFMAILELEFDVAFLATSNCKKSKTSLLFFK